MDPEAWQRFVHLYSPLVYRWCRQAGLQEADAADVGQDVFRAVGRAIGTFSPDGSGGTLRGWLKAITRNKVRDFARGRKRQVEGVGGSSAQARLNEVAADPEPEDPPGGEEDGLLLRRAVELVLADFKDESRTAFLRVVVEGHDPADVARDLGITVNAVYLAKSRIKQRLREEFAGLLDV
jgi:RNA polymerase sigma-70 factor (ECF subfamily)